MASTELFRTDAKCESSKVVLGGHEVSGKRWFCLVVTPTDLPMLFKDDGQSQWASSPAELLGTLVALHVFGVFDRDFSAERTKVVLKAGTDNRSNESTVARASTTKWPLFLFHMQLAEHLMMAGVRLDLRWRPREENEPADDLTNENFERFDMSDRVEVKLEDIDLTFLWSLWNKREEFLDKSAWKVKADPVHRSKHEKSKW